MSLQNTILTERYCQPGETSWEDICKRVSNEVAKSEKDYETWNKKFYDELYNMNFIPGGRILTGGKSKMNCNLIQVEDSRESIGEMLKDVLMISGTGGGVGCSFSELRYKGAPIKGVGGESSGSVSFMHCADVVAGTIKTGGGRRAALMLSLSVYHPDIEYFLHEKLDLKNLKNANVSVEIDRKFIQAVKDDTDWNLVWAGKIIKTVKAKDIWNKLIINAWKSGEPGIINLGLMRELSNSYYTSEILSTNPCLHPDSLIETINGRVKIKDIIEPTMVYTSLSDGSLGIKKASASWISKKDAQTIIIETNNGKKLKCTLDHKILVHDKGWVEAKDIVLGDRLVQLCRARRGAYYSGVKLTTEDNRAYRMEHRLIADAYWVLNESDDVHHIDGDTYNNCIDNFEIKSHSEHSRHTALFDNPQTHQVRGNDSKFISTGITQKSIIPMPEYLRSNMKCKYSSSVCNISVGEIIDVYDIMVEDTHNFISDFTVVHNCGEQPLPAYGSCCLGSINLYNFCKDGRFDRKGFEETIDVAVRFLDDILDINEYPIDKIRQVSTTERRIGLGIMGLHYAMLSCGIKYSSPQGIEFVEKVFEILRNKSYWTSTELAKEKGSFSKFDGEKYLKGNFVKRLPVKIREKIRVDGIRNMCLNTLAPTGTTSIIANVSSGVEPIFSPVYKRTFWSGDVQKKEIVADDLFARMKKDGKDVSMFEGSHDISPEAHIMIQEAAQYYIDSAVSKTINLPKHYPVDDLSELVLKYINNIKGITFYREGSRGDSPLTPLSIDKYKENEGNDDVAKDIKCSNGVCEV